MGNAKNQSNTNGSLTVTADHISSSLTPIHGKFITSQFTQTRFLTQVTYLKTVAAIRTM
jgi:hypothetical protein